MKCNKNLREKPALFIVIVMSGIMTLTLAR